MNSLSRFESEFTFISKFLVAGLGKDKTSAQINKITIELSRFMPKDDDIRQRERVQWA